MDDCCPLHLNSFQLDLKASHKNTRTRAHRRTKNDQPKKQKAVQVVHQNSLLVPLGSSKHTILENISLLLSFQLPGVGMAPLFGSPCNLITILKREHQLSSIIINYHQLSSIIINYHQLSSIIINYHQLSSIIINYHQLSSIIINYHQLSSIIINYHQLSSIIINYHQLSSIIINYHQLSSIIINYHQLSKQF